ncbi:MAG TPA: Gfo/Idh/MocA family oxidoreductase [Candidatus Paceibacterota bacterium]|nr:Gfo/Idh/MocA family oxidoreductase [Verrucomicrobiota bacterium]HRY47684.1 Gfo/Idh/MocA family oxidoreductase [Candidatus Paceibacterota bacterium]HSA03525.1 Gfo/Idh/MocA family oxidoreductase [Candidatus Paceibacterota bacterium]
MNTVRFGIVGLGNMGRFHADYLLAGRIKGAVLTAVSDAVPASLERFPGLKTFLKAEEMIRSGTIDAIIIATPHYLHTTLGIDALENGLHVLVEKPISVHKADCERLLAAHRKPGQVFAAMFQLRTDARYKKLKQLVSQGELGEIFRLSWIITDWYRTEAYYASGGWRATWKGEGGGALLNQCPHNLDLLQWIGGRPSRVRGFCQLGRYHQIEVEDNVTAYLEYPNGATGVFITSTGEAPGTNRFEICGDRGRLVLENGKISFARNEIPMREFSRTARTGFARPDVWQADIPFDGSGAKHEEITQNFVEAILEGKPLIAPAAEGIYSVELANAILYSSLMDATISLPLDGSAYEKKLNQLIAESRFEKKVVEVQGEDFTRSFHR